MRMTHSNNLTIKNDFPQEFPLIWDRYLKESVGLWKNQVSYWMKASKLIKTPIHFFRYEDLLSEPEETLKGIFRFSLKLDKVEGTYAEKRIQEVIAMGEKGNEVY